MSKFCTQRRATSIFLSMTDTAYSDPGSSCCLWKAECESCIEPMVNGLCMKAGHAFWIPLCDPLVKGRNYAPRIRATDNAIGGSHLRKSSNFGLRGLTCGRLSLP